MKHLYRTSLCVLALALAPALASTGCDKVEKDKTGATKVAPMQKPAAGEGAGDGAGAARPATPAADTVAPPKAEDLATYVKDIPGEGKLMAKITTSMGELNCELYEDQTPMTVANFVGLARGLKPWKDPKTRKVSTKPFYEGIIFHRVIPDFMVQVGDPLGVGRGGPGYKFGDEIVPALRHDRGGVLSMANAGRGTNGSQFFITEVATPHLDGRHTVFGRCAEVDLVKQIARVPAGPGNKPLEEVRIEKIDFSRGEP